MKVLITGNQGLIGANLKEFLIDKGYEVKGYDMADKKDILDIISLAKAMKDCNYVYHCAAISDVQACREAGQFAYAVNVKGTEYVAEVANRVHAKLILFSSDKSDKPHLYGTMKRLMEHLYKHKAVILRLATVFGGKEYFKKKPNLFVTHLAKDNPIQLFNANTTKNLVHMSEVLEWSYKAMRLPYGIYDVCSNEVSIKTLGLLAGVIRGVDVKICES